MNFAIKHPNKHFTPPIIFILQSRSSKRGCFMQSWLHGEPPPCTKQPIGGVGGASIILVGALGYSWGIRGVFGEYSWDIHMYRVCIGNVSGMYREYIERYGEGKMRKK